MLGGPLELTAMSRGRQGRGSPLGPAGGSGWASPRGRRLPSLLLATGWAASLARLQRRAPRSRGSSCLESSSLFNLSHARAHICPAVRTRSHALEARGAQPLQGHLAGSPALPCCLPGLPPLPLPPGSPGHNHRGTTHPEASYPCLGASRVLGGREVGGDLGEGGGGEAGGRERASCHLALLPVSAPLSPTVKEIPRQLGSGEAIHLHKHPSSALLLETTDRVSWWRPGSQRAR